LLDLFALAAACSPSVAPTTMAAVVRQESGFRPLAIRVNEGPLLVHQPKSREEAEQIARQLIARGANIDLGLAQINSANLAWLGLSPGDAFEPCKNLAAAAIVLEACYRRASDRSGPGQPALQQALSCYNTDSLRRGFLNGYVQRVAAGSATIVPAIDPHYPITVPQAGLEGRRGYRSIVLRPRPSRAAASRLVAPLGRRGGPTVLYGGHKE
jgi:type IV secretion system protein VirB1